MPETAALAIFFQPYAPWLGWGSFLGGLIFYGVFSAILVYHWRTYAIGATVIRRTFRWYFSATGILLVIAFTSLLWASF